MNATEASRQIQQMVNFILQEAHEKANEIRVKTEHDFNLEKQMLVHNTKLKLQEEYARKEKEREIQKRIDKSAEIGGVRRKQMVVREELLQKLLEKTRAEIASVRNNEEQYKALLENLIVQALLKLDGEPSVVICRTSDFQLFSGSNNLLDRAAASFKEVMERECGEKVQCSLELCAAKDCLPDSCAGGLILTAHGGRVRVDNTLESRLELVYDGLKPVLREVLFPDTDNKENQNRGNGGEPLVDLLS